jgi:16S rRNA (guanine966-N2)-methyltransferase
LGGRTFDSPHGHRTHPMSEKMRGAIFNSLGDIDGMTILDAYAGSGALVFEAISRGAAKALAIDQDKNAETTIRQNINQLGIADRVHVIRANVHGWSVNNPDAQFNIVFCDPPYNEAHATNIQKLVRHVKPFGLLVLSWPGDQEMPDFEGLELLSRSHFNDAQAIYYRRK